MPSSRLMLLILIAALHLAPALVTPLNCEVLVLRLFFIYSMQPAPTHKKHFAI